MFNFPSIKTYAVTLSGSEIIPIWFGAVFTTNKISLDANLHNFVLLIACGGYNFGKSD